MSDIKDAAIYLKYTDCANTYESLVRYKNVFTYLINYIKDLEVKVEALQNAKHE